MLIFLVIVMWAVLGLLALMDKTMRTEIVKSPKFLAFILAIILGPLSYMVFDIAIKSEED